MVIKEITDVTIVNPSCKHGCNHCGYPAYSKVDHKTIKELISRLQELGKNIKLYDMDVTEESLELFSLTGQYDTPRGFGWMNVTENFNPTDEQLSQLERMTVGFCISLHGPDPKTSSILTGSESRHNKLINKYNELRSLFLEKPIGIAMVIHSDNISAIQDMVQLGKDRDVSFMEFINILYAGSAPNRLKRELFLSKDQLKSALTAIKDVAKYCPFDIQLDSTWGPTDHIIPPPKVIPEANHRNCSMFAPALEDKFCNAGYNHVGIRADNLTLFPCPGMSVYKELAIGYFDGKNLIIEDDWPKKPVEGEPCSPCETYDLCKGGCRVSAITEGMKITGKIKKSIGQLNCAKYVMEK